MIGFVDSLDLSKLSVSGGHGWSFYATILSPEHVLDTVLSVCFPKCEIL